MGSIRTQDLYKAVVTEVSGIASSGDVNFTVSTPPSRTNGFLVLSPDNALNRETVYFHNVIGSRIYVRGVNRKNPKAHSLNDLIQMNDVEEIFNYYADMTSPLFYVEKTGSLNVLVWGGTVLVNRTQVTVADTALTLTDNTTNYIVYDYLTNTISANTTGTGLVKATVVTASGIITSITYNVIKESYADPYVPDLALVAPEVQKQTWVYALATGAVNTYAITITPAITSYQAGQKFTFKANLANTGTATLNVNGLGAKTIKKLGGTTNLATGDILLGQIVEVTYNGTNFDMVSSLSSNVDTATYTAGIASIQSSIGGVSMTLGETLATGDIVSIDNATGKVFKTLLQGSDTTVISGSGNITQAKVVALTSTTVVFVGNQGTTNNFYARAGTISGNTITLGSSVVLYTGGGSTLIFDDVIALDSTTFVVMIGDRIGANYYVYAIAGTVSGTTITAGSSVGIINGFTGTTNAVTVGAMTKVATGKFAVSYTYSASNRMTVCTVSGTTISPGAEVGGFAFLPTASCYVSNDKFLLSEGTNARLYTTSGTVPTQGNNLALPATYTSIGLRDIGSSKSIFCGTNSTNTIAFIIDASGATPTNGTPVTVLASSTSNDCFKASANRIGVVTGNNKVYFYSYSGSTLTFENNITTTSSIGTYKSVDYLTDNIFITSYVSTSTGFGYVMSNRPYYIVGILQSGGVLDDVKFVKISGGISTIHSSLTTGLAYYLSNAGLVQSTGTVYIGKALSATSILVAIPYNTL